MLDRGESGTCALLLGTAQSNVHVSGFPVCTIGPVEKEFMPGCLTGFESENGVFSIILTPKRGEKEMLLQENNDICYSWCQGIRLDLLSQLEQLQVSQYV